MQTTQFP